MLAQTNKKTDEIQDVKKALCAPETGGGYPGYGDEALLCSMGVEQVDQPWDQRLKPWNLTGLS